MRHTMEGGGAWHGMAATIVAPGISSLLNLSAEPEGKLRSWLPRDLDAERVVFLPDACPGRSPLPTGTAVLTRQPDWRRFAVSDCGCGMRLVRSGLDAGDLTQARWDRMADAIRARKGGLGDLGGGNHFLDALLPYGSDQIHFLVHTGSRQESGLVDALVDQPAAFDAEFARVSAWARDNRATIEDELRRIIGPCETVMDLAHNAFEKVDEQRTIIRKGAVRVLPGDLAVLPSHMAGDVALVRATERVEAALNSFSHGTGRTVPRSESRGLSSAYDFARLRARVMMPAGLEDASLRTEGPYAYRDLDACLALVPDYVEEVDRFGIIAYMGHL